MSGYYGWGGFEKLPQVRGSVYCSAMVFFTVAVCPGDTSYRELCKSYLHLISTDP